ncbi:hypothetical protein, partial [Citrobacter freundii]
IYSFRFLSNGNKRGKQRNEAGGIILQSTQIILFRQQGITLYNVIIVFTFRYSLFTKLLPLGGGCHVSTLL